MNNRYVLDEFGSGITQNNNPNASVKPFLYAPNNKFDSNVISYSVTLVYYSTDHPV